MPRVRVADRELPLPRSRIARIAIGVGLVFFGILGFLPILGFWMVPLGLVVLSIDVPIVRRWRRRAEVWVLRRWAAWRGRPAENVDPPPR